MINPQACERCGSAEPEYLAIMADAPNPGNYTQDDVHALCKRCRKAFRRWLRRPGSR